MELKIRSAQLSDAEELQKIYTSPSAINGLLQLPYSSIEYYRERLKSLDKNFYQLVAIPKCSETIVGTVGLKISDFHAIKHIGHIHIVVSESYQKKGVGTFLMQEIIKLAFGYLNLHRLELEVFPDNKSAIKLYSKLGFEIEGTKKSAAFRHGKYIDEHIMGLLSASVKDELKVYQ